MVAFVVPKSPTKITQPKTDDEITSEKLGGRVKTKVVPESRRSGLTENRVMKAKKSGDKPSETKNRGIVAKAKAEAPKADMLPHEWLRKVALGEPVPHSKWVFKYDKTGNEVGRELVTEDYYADFPVRVDAAKAAAPFYRPKLASQFISSSSDLPDTLTNIMKELAEKLPV